MAKSKKEIILSLIAQNPNITIEEAAEQSNATLAYTKRIFNEYKTFNSREIISLGRKLGLQESELTDWYDWVVKSLSTKRAVECFRSTVLHDKYLKGEI